MAVGKIKESSPLLWWLAWVVWLPFLGGESVALMQAAAPAPLSVPTFGGIGLFVALYVWGTWKNAKALAIDSKETPPGDSIRKLTLVGLLFGLAGTLAVLGHQAKADITSVYYYSAAYAGGAFPPRRATIFLGLLFVLMGGLGLYFTFPDLPMTIVRVAIVGFVVTLMRRSLLTSRDLRSAQRRIASLAATTERLRIARDLHDLLGHTLSMISLKSELARRLIDQAPARAAKEMTEVEQTARSALHQVREAVSGYRKPDLASELDAAKNLLEAAGLNFVLEGDLSVEEFAPPSEEVLAWAVREGVTNVIRHSQASSCTIRLGRGGESSSVEIVDNGRADAPTTRFYPGNGLLGLKERVEGWRGALQAGFESGRGFRLRVDVPRRHPDVGEST